MKDTNNWDATKYHQHADFVSVLGMPLVDLLNPKINEQIFDLGCGEGTLAMEIKKFGSIVTAIDLSADMVVKSREKGLDAHVMSVIDLPFENNFDAVFSNAVLHWVKESELAVKNIYQSLKNGGRFIAEFGGYGNVDMIVSAMREVFAKHKEYGEFNDLWFFPSVQEYQKILETFGFEVNYIELIPRQTPIDDISNWLDIFANGVITHLAKAQQINFKQEVKELLKPKLYDDKNGWVADYVRLRLKAIKV